MDLNALFDKLQQSRFRASFHLDERDYSYLDSKGLETILLHGADFFDKRLAPAYPPKDGKQTPYRGHPIFVAQHATATCCRGCLHKWHKFPKGQPLGETEKAHVLAVWRKWLLQEIR
jgi:hypothetical protein